MMAFRKSIVLSTQPTSFSALVFQEGLEENIAKISGLGFDGVELAIRDPELLPRARLIELLKESNLAVPAIGTGQAFVEEGLSLAHPEQIIRDLAMKRLQAHMNLAAELGAVVIVGLIRGQKAGTAGEKTALQRLAESLIECAQSTPGVRLAIEPINRYETELLNTVDSTLDFIDSLRQPSIGLLVDTFHMNIEEASLPKSIERAGNRIFHVHVADSNRWYPGAGHIDFKKVIASLTRCRYQGFISAEILPLPDPDTSAANAIIHMRRFC